MTSRRNLRYLFALTASGLLLAASAGPASAERLRTPDPVGDMIVTDDMAGTTTPAPHATDGDIKRVTVRYRVRALSLRVRFVGPAPRWSRSQHQRPDPSEGRN